MMNINKIENNNNKNKRKAILDKFRESKKFIYLDKANGFWGKEISHQVS